MPEQRRFDDVIDHVGMDQIMLLEFTHLSMKAPTVGG